ncbi:transcriptional regulator [Azospirillum sp. TSH100]|uniref:LysR family transcriptional regulator n=1 Tax=Azospirillum sp. TSH100 TaxID=652764 RepID=UPI000D61915E|nr:LysR family transcriptional regulator [Azospirillum sp. TSH100]PWC87489.1 transcriptional regulator [Azospirillum sp. TSH100]QCG89711.1 LysR family transcriptional regulator [Azospirillum sp. TSH100]
MDLRQLRCFVAVAEELHFGRAAQRIGMLPSALGRHIRMLEEDLGTRLLTRTTRIVALTADGACLLDEARALLLQADELSRRFRSRGRTQAATLRVGAIDSAAAGLLPMLLHDFRERHPRVAVQLVEDKTIRLLPRLLSGRLDLVFVRPPESPDRSLEFLFLFHETVVVAVPAGHPLAGRDRVRIEDLADEPVIVPERRSRPHSHDLTIKLFAEAGLQARVAQIAEEKQTIVNLVKAGLGVAIVPRWTAGMMAASVRFIPLEPHAAKGVDKLPLAAAWIRDSRDEVRDSMLATLRKRLVSYAERA